MTGRPRVIVLVLCMLALPITAWVLSDLNPAAPPMPPTPSQSAGPVLPPPRSLLLATIQAVGPTAIDDNGLLAVSKPAGKGIEIYDQRTGQLVRNIATAAAVDELVFSGGGRLIAAIEHESTVDIVRLWDTKTGALRALLSGSEGLYDAVYSPDQKYWAATGIDGVVRVWRVATGELQAILTADAPVDRAIFSPESFRLATTAMDGTVQLWDARTGSLLQTMTGHTRAVLSLAFDPAGRTLVTAAADQTVRLWDLVSAGLPRTIEEFALDAVFSPDGAQLLTAGIDGIGRLWDAAAATLQREFNGHPDAAVAVAYSPEGSVIATASGDSTAKLWDVVTGDQIGLYANAGADMAEGRSPSDSVVRDVAVGPFGDRLATIHGNDLVRIWGRNGELLWTIGIPAQSVRFVEASTVSVAAADGSVYLVDTNRGSVRPALLRPLRALRLVSPGSFMLARTQRGTTHLVNGPTDRPSAELGTSEAVIMVSPDGSRALAIPAGAAPRLWDVADAQPVAGPAEHISSSQIRMSANANAIAWFGPAGLSVWHAPSGSTFSLVQTAITDAAITAGGRQMASLAEDGGVTVWNPRDGRVVATLDRSTNVAGVTFRATRLAVEPAGTVLATTNSDGTLRIWRLATGALLDVVTVGDGIEEIAFTANGETLLVIRANSIELWRTPKS